MHDLPATEPEIDVFLTSFDSGTLPKARWTHAAHLFTGACFVHTLGQPAALAHMRSRVQSYNLAVGGQNNPTSGYHETITRFYIELLGTLHHHHSPTSRATFATTVVRTLAHRRDLLARFYSFDVLASTQARAVWIPPDLRPIRPDCL